MSARKKYLDPLAQICKKGGMVGNRVSHAKNRTKVRLLSNKQNKKIYSIKLKRFVRLKLCTSTLRTINKIGLENYCNKIGLSLT